MGLLNSIEYYRRVAGWGGVAQGFVGRMRGKPVLRAQRIAGEMEPVHLRMPSSDVPVFDQVFRLEEYRVRARRQPQVIVDAGANIGLAARYLARLFPWALILAVEPEASNFELLRRNTQKHANIRAVGAALWDENTLLHLVDPGHGHWGFQTVRRGTGAEAYRVLTQDVRGLTVDTLMKEEGITHIDILKMDIEGAEREVLGNSAGWMGSVDALVVELHDRLRPGCAEAYREATREFAHHWRRGEHEFCGREGGCLEPE